MFVVTVIVTPVVINSYEVIFFKNGCLTRNADVICLIYECINNENVLYNTQNVVFDSAIVKM